MLSGRNRGKLDALAGELGGKARVQPASLDDAESLRSLLDDCAAVINCAGPFTLHGEPVLRAAVETATHYLDTTGEQTYMRLALERYGPGAPRPRVAVIPAMGFDYMPGDMIAALTAEGMGEVDEVSLAYDTARLQGRPGARRLSALEMLKGGDVEWRKLQWLPADQSVGRGSFDFPEPIGRKRMTRYPAGRADHGSPPHPDPPGADDDQRFLAGAPRRSARCSPSLTRPDRAGDADPTATGLGGGRSRACPRARAPRTGPRCASRSSARWRAAGAAAAA